MGSGCLAPKPIQGDLTSQLIQQIHQLPPNNNKQQKYIQNEAVYAEQKQKIFKKAPLRKLLDYLSSHRHKIIDSLTHNIKICVDKGTQYSWTVGLVILERVVMMATQGMLRQSITPNIQQILKNKPQNGSNCLQSQTLRDNKSLKTEIEKQNKSSYFNLKSNPSQIISNQIMSPRFQSVLFDTINACLQQPTLYKECLRILCDYLQAKPKSLNSQDKVKNVILALQNNIKVDYQGVTTLQAYYQIVCKLKDKVVLAMCDELKVIIKMWMYMKDKINNSKSMSLINTCESKISWIQMIIGRFLTSSLDGMQYNHIIKLLMQVQDQYFFDISLQFQSLYVYILTQSELGPHFLKALFLQYLRYGVMGSFSQPQFNEISQNSRQLLSCNQINYSNICSKQTRKNLYGLIKRWLIGKRYISLGQIITYNSSLFIYCFLQDEPVKHICLDLLKQTNTQQRIILIQASLELYQRKQTSSFIRNLLFAFHKTPFQHLKTINLKQNVSRFAVDVTYLSSFQSIQLYISLMQLYCQFDKETFGLYLQQICQLLASIVSFLHQDTTEKDKLIASFLNFIEFIISADVAPVAIACFHQIQRIVQRKILKEEQSLTINKLLQQIKGIFKRNHIQDHIEPKTNIHQQNEDNNFDRLGDYSCYFKQLINENNQTKSQLGNTNQFQKSASVIKSEIREQESIQDILQMINY